ncbi:hypothetical+protein [Methylocapsa aurea]|jgi:hypothetical protein|uniref:hypothetical protein n=1 Tax=Methylocapsa aurea TaxID=663610 RepID=UPI003D18AAD2
MSIVFRAIWWNSTQFEKSISKIKSVCARIAGRAVEALEAAIAKAPQSFMLSECSNLFRELRL